MRAMLAIAVVVLTACQSSATPAQPTPMVAGPGANCAPALFTVTGTAGESLHPQQLPAGLTLEGPAPIGGNVSQQYTRYSDLAWLQIAADHTPVPFDEFIAGRAMHPITIQGLNGAIAVSGQLAAPDVDVMWMQRPGLTSSYWAI